MWDDRLKNNTFGLELEFGDADKSKILMPKGYAWTDNDLTRMHNSDGSAVTHSGQYGGEINTRPYKYTEEDLNELKDFIKQIKDAGGYLMWNEGFDSHFYVRNLPLEAVKRLFELSYWVAPYVKKIFHLAVWFEGPYLCPSPDYSYVEKVNAVSHIDEIPPIFANSSHRGQIRFYINLVPVTKIGTVEFRLFNGSWKWEETLETIKFMYSFVNYALVNEDPAKYKELDSVEKCLEAFNVDPTNIPTFFNPLLWAQEHTNNMTLIGEPEGKNKALMSKLISATKNFKTVHVVNSYFMDIEQVLANDVIRVYTKSNLIQTLYSIILADTKLELPAPFDWMKTEEGDKAERVAKLMLYTDIKKSLGDDFYHNNKLTDYKKNYDKYVAKYKLVAERIVMRLEKKDIQIIPNGDILDAIAEAEGSPDDVVIYQSEFYQKTKSIDRSLALYAKEDYNYRSTPYSEVNLENVNYVVFSKHAHMGLPKIYRSDRVFLYSNIDVKTTNKFSSRPMKPVFYKKIPDDYQFTNKSRLRFMRAKMSEVDYLRAMYMKKDILLGGSPFSYLWFVDDYLIGASMFDFSKQGLMKAWMKSDFVIDSNQSKLSKLLIMGVLSTEFAKELKVKYRTDLEAIHTTVFTNKPVSMKYRGVYTLAKKDAGKLHYEAPAGKLGNLKQVMNKYVNSLK